MNRNRRDKLKLAIEALEAAEGYVNSALEEEQDCLDNIPENLEGSDRYEKMEAAIDKLEEAIGYIDSIKECLEEAAN